LSHGSTVIRRSVYSRGGWGTFTTFGADLRTEEVVKIHFLLPYLAQRGYTTASMVFEQGIEVQEGRRHKTIFPDIVVYSSPQRKAP
jgi:hypothetical protein